MSKISNTNKKYESFFYRWIIVFYSPSGKYTVSERKSWKFDGCKQIGECLIQYKLSNYIIIILTDRWQNVSEKQLEIRLVIHFDNNRFKKKTVFSGKNNIWFSV